MKNILFLFVALGLTCHVSYAQYIDSKNVSATIAPLHLFTGSIKPEIELRFKRQMHSLAVAPQYYFSYMGEGASEGGYRFTGYGAELQHKLFLNKITDSISTYDWRTYFAYGVAYSIYKNEYRSDVWYGYEDKGLTYYTFGRREINDEINRWRISLLTGVQKRTYNFLFEAFAGLSYQTSEINSNYEEVVDYREGTWNYGYTGLVPRIGFKIGMFLF